MTSRSISFAVIAVTLAAASARAEQAARPAPAAARAMSAAPAAPSAPVELNAATEAELIGLPGIGPAKARAVLEYRKRTPFAKVEDLLKVRGIGRGIFRQVRDHVTVRAPSGRRAEEPRAPAAPPPSPAKAK